MCISSLILVEKGVTHQHLKNTYLIQNTTKVWFIYVKSVRMFIKSEYICRILHKLLLSCYNIGLS